jgi:spore germination protein
VRPAVLEQVEKRISEIDIDAILDSGSLEQLIEDNWLSPFPQAQLTERPDKTASAVLEGRIAIIVDNSPFALIVPVTLNCFFQSSEDYYNRWQIMSLTRFIRFAAALMTVALPGLYIAVATFHPSMIPMLMATKLAAASQNVPFPAIIEIILMDAAFELLREAGVRLPGAVGGTIGIVGGLIIGQAAVEAGVVSPIVVIIVALTGVAAFAIPHVSLVYGFRIIKYVILLLSAFLGFFGFWAGLLIALTHLASLRSFGIPYIMPFAAGELNQFAEMKDSIFRFPLFTLRTRPFFADKGQRIRQKGGK